MRKILLPVVFCAILMAFSFCAKAQSELPIRTFFTEIDSLQLEAPRPMVIFLHTDWCRYCQNMQRTTLRDPDVNLLLNDRFYFLSLNAETEETIIFGNQSFPFQPTGNGTGAHTLATAIGTINGQLQYPTLIIMNENYEIIFQHGAFIPADMFLNVLTATLK